MEDFIALVIVVFGILQIILFFKIWGMTENVRNIARKFCGSTKLQNEPINKIIAKYAILNEKEKALQYLDNSLEDKLDKLIFNRSSNNDWKRILEEYRPMYKYFGEDIPSKYSEFTVEKFQQINEAMFK